MDSGMRPRTGSFSLTRASLDTTSPSRVPRPADSAQEPVRRKGFAQNVLQGETPDRALVQVGREELIGVLVLLLRLEQSEVHAFEEGLGIRSVFGEEMIPMLG
jgi:hypothetical protein